MLNKEYFITDFDVDMNTVVEKETIEEYEISFKFKNKIELTNIKKIFNNIAQKDGVSISFHDFSTDKIHKDTDEGKINQLLDEVNTDIGDESVMFNLTVTKNDTECINVYSANIFYDYLNKLKPYGLIKIISDLIIRNKLHFKLLNDDYELQTETFSFSKTDISVYLKRDDIKTKFNDISKIHGNFMSEVIPQDFKVLSYNNKKEKVIELVNKFEKIEYLLSLMFISNEFDTTGDAYKFSIYGYKNIEICFEQSTLYSISKNKTISKICAWCYDEGNIVDKVHIARNIISLYSEDNNLNEINDAVFDSIIGNYSLYLKNHIENYLKLKEDATNKFQEICDEISNQVSKLSGSLKNNFLAILGYLVTVLITEGFSDGIEGIFSYEITIISSFVLAGSLIVYILSLAHYLFNKKYLSEKLDKWKEYYNDTITEKELNYITENNTLINFAEKQSLKQTVLISIFWVVSIIALFLSLDKLSGDTPLLFFINFFKK